MKRPSFRRLRLVLATAAAALLLPLPAAPAAADVDTSPVRVNQIGYLTGADKIATVVATGGARAWQVRQASGGTAVASGTTTVYGSDRASGDTVQQADFTALTTPGDYVLWVDGVGTSVPFTISASSLYPALGREAMQYFYFHRMGAAVDGQFLQNAGHAHAALHPGDESVPCFNSWCGSQRLNVRYSWADAGDFGIYTVNHAVSAWTLLNLLEREPAAYGDGSLSIPERANGRPDLLDEVEFGSRWMAGLLPSTGLASHKVHNHAWSAFPVTSVDSENGLARSAMGPSTNATYAVARTNAQLARVLAPYDAARAATLWGIAKDAWTRAEAQPNVDYNTTSDADGGGDYGDTKNSDDRYAAAAELYLTALKRADSAVSGYRTAVTGSPHYREMGQFDWAEVAATGTLSLVSVANDLPAADLSTMRANVRAFADQIVTTLRGEGYPSLIGGASAYPWGSNSFIANRMLVLGVAYDDSGSLAYLKAMNRAMDYLMGNNAMRLSYVTGYGEYSESDLHDRWAWGKYPGLAYPKGWLAGGPNNELINDPATPTGRPAAKSYAPKNTAPDAWGSKENTINWNAPLAWVATYLDRNAADLTGGTPPDVTPPTVPANLRVTATSATSVGLAWDASTDNVGVVGYDVYRGTAKVGTPTGTSYTDTGLTPSTAYQYTVRARDAGGYVSAASTAVTATTQSGDVVPPAAPQNLRVTATGSSTLTITWDAVPTAVSYAVRRGSVQVAVVTGTSYTDTGLSPSTAYTYTVQARNAAGDPSVWSAPITATTTAPPTGGGLTVRYKNNDGSPTDNSIRFGVQVVNSGTAAIGLTTVTARYYLTRDGAAGVTVYCDWAQVGCANVRTTVVNLATPVAGADTYVEIAFTGGTLAAGASTGEVQLRLHKADWSPFNEVGDYSRGANTAFADAPAIPGYAGGVLSWGTPPA
ncbi:glycoside hydrolase family 9 protein [Catellatospora vulcania]|uniref:glycoside hydrolase family 9 protein n=1 Tax=Catellatospora vulcania TaxID=1460450 RepID=UPI0012D48EFE|nr:glycoside hydrolase family 9 protein [Catellatospora vulcania]